MENDDQTEYATEVNLESLSLWLLNTTYNVDNTAYNTSGDDDFWETWTCDGGTLLDSSFSS